MLPGFLQQFRLAEGWHYYVCFKDLAGNPQSKVGSAKVVVR